MMKTDIVQKQKIGSFCASTMAATVSTVIQAWETVLQLHPYVFQVVEVEATGEDFSRKWLFSIMRLFRAGKMAELKNGFWWQ